MNPLLRKFIWWTQRRRKEDELREELQFHLEEGTHERLADGLAEDQARRAARRDLGNVMIVQEDTRTLWTWILLEQLVQDVRYGLRTLGWNLTFAIALSPSPTAAPTWRCGNERIRSCCRSAAQCSRKLARS